MGPAPPGSNPGTPPGGPPGPLPGPRRDVARGPRPTERGVRGHPGGTPAGPDEVRRRDRTRPRGPERPPGGRPPLRPGHRHVPRISGGLVRPYLPGRRGGAARRMCQARHRRDGHQDRRLAPLGRPDSGCPELVRAPPDRCRHRTGHPVRPADTRSARLLHPQRPGYSPTGHLSSRPVRTVERRRTSEGRRGCRRRGIFPLAEKAVSPWR